MNNDLMYNLKVLFCVIMGFAFFAAPWFVQNTLYLLGRLIFRKSKSHKIYTACFFLNCIILFFLFQYQSNENLKNMEEPFDAFNDLILLIFWTPSFLAVLISCLVREISCLVREHKAKKSEKSNEEITEENKEFEEIQELKED